MVCSSEEEFVASDNEAESEAEARSLEDSDFGSDAGGPRIRPSNRKAASRCRNRRQPPRRRRRPRGYSDEEEEESDEEEEEEMGEAFSFLVLTALVKLKKNG